ncbi:MAG TPA: YcgN family cysteine cluster protein [Novosphingobium sp.]|nr:YcgN family cysteine cluster protein [Novosphingobium sp.]HZV10360.1 YcgN family cysteine cluster protein [Novosphingobium sp.]
MSGPVPFWERPVHTLSREEWEALCDGCGQCCLHKVEDADTGDIYPTNVACKLLDIPSGRCSDYAGRRRQVPDCVRLTPRLAATLPWLPDSCAYRLRAAGEPLPAWHYLVCGDREAVHAAGASVRGKAISEVLAGPLEQHIVWPGEPMEVVAVEDAPSLDD